MYKVHISLNDRRRSLKEIESWLENERNMVGKSPWKRGPGCSLYEMHLKNSIKMKAKIKQLEG